MDRTGYRGLYQIVPAVFSFAFGAAGLLLLADALRRVSRDDGAVIATAVVWLATPAVYYLTIEPLMGHSLSLGLACCLVALILPLRGPVTAARFALLGLVCGLLTITRYQDAAYFLLPMTLAPGQWWRAILATSAGAAPVIAIQLVASYLWYGSPWITGYGGVLKPDWLTPDVWRHLFSPLHGVFTTHPIQLFGLVGLIWLSAIHMRLVVALWVIFIAQLYAVAALIPAAPGMSFGNRTLTSLTPAFVLGWYSLSHRFPPFRPVGAVLVCANIALLVLYCVGLLQDF